jgi:hypothetical protein
MRIVPGIGELFHPCGEMGRLADGGVIHAQIRADRPHDHFPRVQADSDLDLHPELATHALGVSLHRLLHPKRRVARPHCVVLVSERRAEQRHDPVTHYLVDGALVAVHRVHHVLDNRVEELARLLGITVGEQLHRALEVGEQHRHLLALPLERGLGREDPLGEVLGGIAIRRPQQYARSSGNGMSAGVAELGREGERLRRSAARRRRRLRAMSSDQSRGRIQARQVQAD